MPRIVLILMLANMFAANPILAAGSTKNAVSRSLFRTYFTSIKNSLGALFHNPMAVVWHNPREHRSLLATAAIGAGGIAAVYLFLRSGRNSCVEKKDNPVPSYKIPVQEPQEQSSALALLRRLSYQDLVLLPDEEKKRELRLLFEELAAHDAVERAVTREQDRLNAMPITDETPPDIRRQREQKRAAAIVARTKAEEQLKGCTDRLFGRLEAIQALCINIKQGLITRIYTNATYVHQSIEGKESVNKHRAHACEQLAKILDSQEKNIDTLPVDALKKIDFAVQLIKREYEEIYAAAIPDEAQELLDHISEHEKHIMQQIIYASVANDQERKLKIRRYEECKEMITEAIRVIAENYSLSKNPILTLRTEFCEAEKAIDDYRQLAVEQKDRAEKATAVYCGTVVLGRDALLIGALQEILAEIELSRRRYDEQVNVLDKLCEQHFASLSEFLGRPIDKCMLSLSKNEQC